MTANNDTAVISEPVVDKLGKSSGVGRLLLLGIFLFVGVTALGVFGQERLGAPMFLAVLGVFASVGVFFLFALLLGMVQLSSSRRSDEFLKTLVGDMDTGVVVTDFEGRVVYANRAYAEMTGAEMASDVGSVEAVFSRVPDAADIIYRLSNAAKVLDSGVEEFRVQSGLLNDQEGARWFRMRARGIEVPGYAKPLSAWYVSDVTMDRQRHEHAFKELQDAIHYLDHAPAGFLSSETNGKLAYINATLADWLGLDLARFESGSVNMSDIIVGDNVALLEAPKSDDGGPTTLVVDLDMIRSDGTLLPVRLYHKIPTAEDGAPGSSRTLVLNRMVDTGIEDALRDSEVRFARFFNSTPLAIASLNKSGEIVRSNAAFLKMFGPIVKDAGQFYGMKYTKIVAKDDRANFKDIFQQALAHLGDIKPVDLAIEGNADRHVRLFVSPVADTESIEKKNKANKDDERVIIYAMETTEQRALEEQFAQGQKMQAVGQLAGGIAHDFNNVLTAIIGFSDLLLSSHKPSDPSFQDIMNIKQNANRAASLVRQLLAFSRRQTLRPQVLQLSDVLSDLRMLLDRLLGEKVDLEVKHGRDLWPTKVDISQLEQVIVNLAVNARDAMLNGGKLEIRTSNVDAESSKQNYSYKGFLPGEYVLIEVEDQGTGMSQEVVDKIFEPFFSTKEVGKGTGLGLSTVYGIIKQTGGYIFPESTQGKGTIFRVFLPRHEVTEEEERAQAVVEKPDEPAKDLTGNATILLVEDEDAVRAFGSRALAARGYKVHQAASGVEALEVVDEIGDEIDLVVSDVVMPEMDGPTLLRELRKTRPDLKFIFVSGYAEEAFSKNLPEEERGNFGFLAKPFSLKELAETVKEMLEKT